MSKLTLGTQLLPATRRHVLSAFVYRLTLENGYPLNNPTGAKVEPITDQQWLEQYAFYTTKSGKLDRRYNYCERSYLAE